MAKEIIHLETYTPEARTLIVSAQELADRKQHATCDSLHLLSRTLEQPEIASIFQKIGADPKTISNLVDQAMDRVKKSDGTPSFLSGAMTDLLERAQKDTDGNVGLNNILNALAGEIRGETGRILQKFSIEPGVFRPYAGSLQNVIVLKSTSTFTKDLIELAKVGKFGITIGRDQEVRRLLQILSRSSKNSPLLVGEGGSGKTAIVQEIAKRLHKGEVAPNLSKVALVELEIPALTSGVKSRTEIEERVKQTLDSFKRNDKEVIIVIDGVENLFSQTQMMNIADLFKTMLMREEVRIFGLTTPEGLRKLNEKDTAFVRKFTTLTIETPSTDQAIEVVRGVANRFEKFHSVNIGEGAITAAVNLAKRYIQDKALPDSALDILDEAAARKHLELTGMPADLDRDVRRLESLKAQTTTLENDTDAMSLKTLDRIRKEIDELEPKVNVALEKLKTKKEALNSINSLREEHKKYVGELDTARANKSWSRVGELQEAIIPMAKSKLDKAEAVLADKSIVDVSNVVSENDVAVVVGELTNIPVSSMVEDEVEKLKRMEDALKKRVVGQEQAVGAVSKAVRRGRLGLKNKVKPYGSFLFLGSSGIGKTEVSKALAEFLFNDEQTMIRFDMAEYMASHSVATMLGSPPGYQGSEKPGRLIETLKKHPYSVLLFDEIEKAHPDVFNILLAVLDDGRVTSATGETVSASNTVVILTSNLGSKKILEEYLKNESIFETPEGHEHMKTILLKAMSDFLRPEFINRLDDVITFKPLSKQTLRGIVDIQVRKIEQLVADRELKLDLTEEAKLELVEQGYEPQFGARPLNRSLTKNIQDPLTEAIISNTYKNGTTIRVSLDKEKKFVFG